MQLITAPNSIPAASEAFGQNPKEKEEGAGRREAKLQSPASGGAGGGVKAAS